MCSSWGADAIRANTKSNLNWIGGESNMNMNQRLVASALTEHRAVRQKAALVYLVEKNFTKAASYLAGRGLTATSGLLYFIGLPDT